MTLSNPDTDDVPSHIAPAEELGRGVFSSRDARRSKIPDSVFLERRGIREMSVDRLTYATPDTAAEIADQAATARGRTFYGWAVVTTAGAAQSGRCISASPLPDGANPFHASIMLPASAIADWDEQKRHARELADASRWRRRP